jgi:hypothetical protein
MDNFAFCDVMPCDSCKIRRFGGMYCFHLQVKNTSNQRLILRGVLQLLVTANVVPISLIIFTLKMEAIRSSDTLVLIRVTWHHIPETTFFIVAAMKT